MSGFFKSLLPAKGFGPSFCAFQSSGLASSPFRVQGQGMKGLREARCIKPIAHRSSVRIGSRSRVSARFAAATVTTTPVRALMIVEVIVIRIVVLALILLIGH